MSTGTVIVLAGGDAPHPRLALPAAAVVIAADSGADRAAGLGLTVDVLVGDLDSIDAAVLAALEGRGTRIDRHPRDKDATDIALALDLAAAHDPTRLVLVGGHGGRLDHAVATLGALAATAVAVGPACRVEAWMGPAHVALAVPPAGGPGGRGAEPGRGGDGQGQEGGPGRHRRDRRDVEPGRGGDRGTVPPSPGGPGTGGVRLADDARSGELVSLVPVGGPVRGVTTVGLRWPLVDATLPPGSTWGVSNEVVAAPAGVTVTGGTLAVIRPHALDG